MNDKSPQAPRLLTIRQLSERHPAFSEGGLRWLRFNCQTNGFASAFKTVGRRVLIDEGRFFEIIERQNSPEHRLAGGPGSVASGADAGLSG